jgi:heterodisulfide reductase subunit C
MGETIPLQRKPPDPATLRGLVFASTGYDVRRCGRCSFCVKHARSDEEDLSLEMLVQLILQNDEEVLTSKTLWSDSVLNRARSMCLSTMDMPAIMLALRDEARRRGLVSNGEGQV